MTSILFHRPDRQTLQESSAIRALLGTLLAIGTTIRGKTWVGRHMASVVEEMTAPIERVKRA